MKGKKKPADMDAFHNFIVQADARNIGTQLVAQKLVIKKNTSQGNESYDKTSTNEDLHQKL